MAYRKNGPKGLWHVGKKGNGNKGNGKKRKRKKNGNGKNGNQI